jgi:hypothetical protein
MRPSLRFLALVMVGWAGMRAATLDSLPGGEMFRIGRSEAKPSPPPIVATQFPPIEPIADFEAAPLPPVAAVGAGAAGGAAQNAAVWPQPIRIPVYYPAPAPAAAVSVPSQFASFSPVAAPQFYSPIPALDEWPLARIASAPMSGRRSTVILPAQSIPEAFKKIDRLQLTAWALVRSRQAVLGPTSLASGGTLGGSQAGARLTYQFTRQIAASLRSTSDIGRRGGEVAAGIRLQPLVSLPVWLTAERRQQLGRLGSGRNAFALFVEGGLYQRPMPWNFALDAYFQGGVVGLNRRDRFVDAAVTLTRPVYRQFSAGLGLWGGAQPGVYRVDAGPRVTMKVRDNMRVHFDWRQRLAGNAQPGSGPAITLAGDF